MRGKAVTVNVRMPKAKRGSKKRSRRGPYQTLKSTGWVRGSADSVARFGPTKYQATPEQLAARKAWHYRGNGMYRGFGRDVGGLVGGVAGTMVGGLGDIGAEAGRWLGATAADITGWGAGPYTVANNIVNNGEQSGVPSFGPSDANTVTVTHKEYICDIFGPEVAGTFQNQTFSLNPGLSSTFPWLSQIAANFDEYSFGQLMFTYRSTVTDFVANNGQVGSVILATQYNADDAPFQTKQDAMEYDGAISGKCSADIIAGVECDPAKNSGSQGKYVRAGPTPSNEDIKTYDLGTLNVAISNPPAAFANQALGELWVSYTIQLRKPKFFVSRALNLPTDIHMGKLAPNYTAVGWSTLGNLQLAQCQQNRINTELLKTFVTGGATIAPAADTLYLRFPSNFSGDVDIKITTALRAADAQAGESATATIQAYSNANLGIIPIKDMIACGTDPVGSNGPYQTDWVEKYGNYLTGPSGASAWGIQGPLPTSMVTGGHYRIVAPATAQTNNAVDNYFTIRTPNSFDQHVYLLIVTVTLYNTGMNSRVSGRPVMLDSATQQVIQWP